MKRLFITKENLKSLIADLKTECDEFIAPKREHLDDIVFGDTKDSGGELSDYDGNSVISPRAFLLPQTEALFEINSARDSSLVPVIDGKTRIFYGVRPCDMKALNLAREFFTDDYVDGPYVEKMNRSTFIVLACDKRCSKKSFCGEMDAGPVSKEGYDLQLFPIGKGYLVEAGSDKGSRIIKRNKRSFARAASGDEREVKALIDEFTKGTKKIDYKKLAGMMRKDKIPESVWDDIGLRCVVCSGCVTLCPTCTCFSITDRLNGNTGERTRYCDGCPYTGFTRMAGGSIPEPRHKDHIRRFFEHKLNVDVKRYGTPSCVGCARCIQTCPGNISIRKFIEDALMA